MFTRARLRIAGLYVALLGLIVVVVAGSLVLLAARDARQTADLELRLRAEGLAAQVLRGGPASPAPPRRGEEDDGDDHGRDGRDRALERAGFLTYVLPIAAGGPATAASGGIPGLPDEAAAREALNAGGGQYTTLALPQGRVRLYSLPVRRNGDVVAVVQVVRSQTFVDATVRRLLVSLLVSAVVGLAAAALAGYWLAGRTLRPIADALQRQRDFVADASHELRTPLAVIRGNIEHMRRAPDKPVRAYDDVMEDIEAESERLGRLVSGLLTLARADDGRVQLRWSRVDLTALMQALAREVAPLAEAKGLALRTAIEPGVSVYGDADRLHELGLILLDNAIRYTAAGHVSLELELAGATAVLRVADTGPGIAPEHLPRIFDRFYRTPAARSSEAGGTGLGLAIARWIAEAHGGRITVTSAIGQGSTFTVYLPRRAAKQAADAGS
jgi:two-component system sensor histidine kinase CiaH